MDIITLSASFLCIRYVVSYAENNYGEPQRLTQGGYSHAVTLNEVKKNTDDTAINKASSRYSDHEKAESQDKEVSLLL